VVQGVHGGPTTVLVAAFGGVQPLQQGALAPWLDFGGKPNQAEEGARPADGAFPAPGGRCHALLGPGLADQGPAVAAGTEVGRGRVPSGYGQNSAQRDTTTRGGHELVTHQQIMPAVNPLNMLQPALGGPPTRHSRIHTRRYRAAQQRPRWQRIASVATARWP